MGPGGDASDPGPGFGRRNLGGISPRGGGRGPFMPRGGMGKGNRASKGGLAALHGGRSGKARGIEAILRIRRLSGRAGDADRFHPFRAGHPGGDAHGSGEIPVLSGAGADVRGMRGGDFAADFSDEGSGGGAEAGGGQHGVSEQFADGPADGSGAGQRRGGESIGYYTWPRNG